MIARARRVAQAGARACGVASVAALLVATGASMAGCSLRNDFFLRDTEGSSFRASCSRTECAAVVESPSASRPAGGCAGGTRAGFALAGRGVVVACHACVGGAGAPRVDLARCRAVACDNDTECAPFHAGAAVRCVHGLCQTPARTELDETAAAGLCMAGAGPSGSDGAAHVEDRLALARAACDPASGRCRDPQGCRAR